jgi:hypothetical protein
MIFTASVWKNLDQPLYVAQMGTLDMQIKTECWILLKSDQLNKSSRTCFRIFLEKLIVDQIISKVVPKSSQKFNTVYRSSTLHFVLNQFCFFKIRFGISPMCG